uniref:SEFIR domain-containing protein n=1 Tax=Heterorhabditis bacteriophora TaxID=37862 RepID=A0A1I7XK98_HETBA
MFLIASNQTYFSIVLFSVPCDIPLFDTVLAGEEPPEAHDVRVEAFAKAMARQKGRHQLHVDVSWQMPPRNNSFRLRAFKLEIRGPKDSACFSFNVTDFEWTQDSASVRLLDETGIELLHHTIVKASDMKQELISGKLVPFGEYNFTGLELDVDYIPSVIPVELSSDGRCLCPTSEQHGACSCIAADWKKVRLHRIEKSSPIINTTLPPVDLIRREDNRYWIIYTILILSCLLFVLCGVVTIVIMVYKKYRKRGKAVRIRFISDHVTNNGMVVSEPHAPLIYHSSTSVLLIYTHDCPQHESSVLAFAELLRDMFGMEVHLDVWDENEIEKNVHEYINSSIVRADKVIVINSIGSYYRMRARHLKEDPIERVNAGTLDSLFGNQIDLALQHARVISVRFSYTPGGYTLFALTPLLQYTIPDNLGLLVTSLNDCPIRNDPRLAGFNPELSKLNAAVSRMAQYIESEPKWFVRSHHRVHRAPTIEKSSGPIGNVESPMKIIQPYTIRNGVMQSTVTKDTANFNRDSSHRILQPISLQTIEASNSPSVDTLVKTSLQDDELPLVNIKIPEVRDKPRLNNCELAQKDPRHALVSGDSGLIEDMESGLLSS